MAQKIFKLMLFTLLEDICESKKLNLDNLLMSPRQNYPPGSFHHRPVREVTCFPRQHLFENIFPKQKAGRKLLVVHKSNQLEL